MACSYKSDHFLAEISFLVGEAEWKVTSARHERLAASAHQVTV